MELLIPKETNKTRQLTIGITKKRDEQQVSVHSWSKYMYINGHI